MEYSDAVPCGALVDMKMDGLITNYAFIRNVYDNKGIAIIHTTHYAH